MEKTEIKTQLEGILQAEKIQDHLNKGKELCKTFWSIYNAEQKELQNASEERESAADGDDVAVEESPVSLELDEQIKELISQFNEKKANLEKQVAEEEKKNLEIKQGLITRLRNLIQHEENIGALFNEIKEIQSNWKEVGNIPRKVAQEINQEYHNLTEQFYYNINIYKELKENDLKKNYSLKNQIVHKMKDLMKEDKINAVQDQLRILQNEWAEIGPTYQEHWDKLKEEYYSTQNQVYDKIRNFYEQRKEQQAKNLEIKKSMLEKAKELVATETKDVKSWDNVTKKLLALQEEWKQVGFAPAKENKEIWKEFRGLYNEFFDRKSEFFKGQNEVYSENGKRKEKLIERASRIDGSKDFKAATQQILSLQKEWKRIGHAGKHAEQKLWKKFRAACDDFFTKKDAHFKEKDEANAANLTAKEGLIKEIEAYKVGTDQNQTIADLKEFSRRFAEIGNVPFSEKDRIYKAYKTIIDKHYDSLKLSAADKDRILFESKIDQILASSNPGKMIRAEKDRIRKKIGQLTGEINQYENNLGFFKNSKGAEALLGDVNAKIDKAKNQIDTLKRQLKLIPKEEN